MGEGSALARTISLKKDKINVKKYSSNKLKDQLIKSLNSVLLKNMPTESKEIINIDKITILNERSKEINLSNFIEFSWDDNDIKKITRSNGLSYILKARTKTEAPEFSNNEIICKVIVLRKTPIWVANKHLPKGSTPKKSFFHPEMRKKTSLGENNIDWTKVANLVLKRSLRKGEPLVIRHLMGKAVVKRGQMLRISIGSSAIKISATVKALEDGRVGEVVRVVYPRTRKILSAKIYSEHKVKLLW